MKFSTVIAFSTLAAFTVSALPLELAYRSQSAYYQARDALPTGQPYPRAAAPTAEVPEVNPALHETDPDTNNDTYQRPSMRQRREAVRAKSAGLYEREAEADPEAEPVPDPEPEASPEDLTLDEASRAALLRRLIDEEKRAEEKVDEYIKSFRFHRRAADYATR